MSFVVRLNYYELGSRQGSTYCVLCPYCDGAELCLYRIKSYSRLITYLQVATNNRASTVLSAFLNAVDEFSLPSRVLSDRGGENVLVASYMLSHAQRGPDRGSIITGRSTHNQHI